MSSLLKNLWAQHALQVPAPHILTPNELRLVVHVLDVACSQAVLPRDPVQGHDDLRPLQHVLTKSAERFLLLWDGEVHSFNGADVCPVRGALRVNVSAFDVRCVKALLHPVERPSRDDNRQRLRVREAHTRPEHVPIFRIALGKFYPQLFRTQHQ